MLLKKSLEVRNTFFFSQRFLIHACALDKFQILKSEGTYTPASDTWPLPCLVLKPVTEANAQIYLLFYRTGNGIPATLNKVRLGISLKCFSLSQY